MALSVVIGLLLVVFVVCRFYRCFQRIQTLPVDTIKRMVHSILRQSELISSLQSPELALIQSRECQASLYTLVHLFTLATIDSVCGIDTVALQNILYFQESQIREFIQNQLDE